MNTSIIAQQVTNERKKYITAFNTTMIKIWKEQITLLGVIDTGMLLGLRFVVNHELQHSSCTGLCSPSV